MLALTVALLTISAEVPRSARLLDDVPLLAQAELAPPLVTSPDADVSWQQLQADIDALRRQRPSIGSGVALVITGGGVALLGGYFMLMAGLTAFTSSLVANPFFVLGVVFLAAAAPVALIGVWLLYNRLDQRGRIDDEVKRLRALQQQKRANEPPRPPPPRYGALAPSLLPDAPSLTVATF